MITIFAVIEISGGWETDRVISLWSTEEAAEAHATELNDNIYETEFRVEYVIVDGTRCSYDDRDNRSIT